MTRRIMMLVIAAMVAVGAGQTFAHSSYRVIGTVVSLDEDNDGSGWAFLAVRPQGGRLVKILMGRETVVYRDKKKARVTELKAGRYVVVDAVGDSMNDLLASEVRIIPSLPK